MLLDNLKKYKVVLGSQSPRRRELLAGMDIEFESRVSDADESFDPDMPMTEIPEFLALQKAKALESGLGEDELLITSDTIVCLDGKIYNKPESEEEAVGMLTELAGNTHTVITGVCIKTAGEERVFHDSTEVTFTPLTQEEILNYIRKCQPYDKAGSYGIQEWLGYAAIDCINGSFYTVMGLPTQKLYQELKKIK